MISKCDENVDSVIGQLHLPHFTYSSPGKHFFNIIFVSIEL